MKSAYVTDSYTTDRIGHGGSVVSFHELRALTHVAGEPQVYQRVGKLFFEQYYQIPFMYDYWIASLLSEPEKIELAHFYGASFNLTAKLMLNARKFATVPAHNLEESLREWGTFGYWQSPPPHLMDDYLFRYLVHGLKKLTVVTPSTNSALYLKRKLNVESVVIPHGCDYPTCVADKPSDFSVLHISSFGPDKGQIYLFKAWKLMQTSGNLIMVCNNIVDTALQNIQNINVTHQVSEQEKIKLYQTASVYVQPSVTEGWGLTVGEAMANGTPVIVTEGVGAKDMVTDGKDGFIVPIRNPDRIAELIKYFHDNPSEIKRMGRNARNKAKMFSWSKIEEQYVKLYESS